MSQHRGLDLDQCPDGIVIADETRTVVEVNSAATRMLGRDLRDCIGIDLATVMSLDDREGNEWFDATCPYDGFALRRTLSERSWFTNDGRELLVTARLVRDHPRAPVIRVVVSLRDAHARAHYDRDRSDLVATVAHELRSPLTGVKGFTATLLTNWDRFSDSQKLLMLQTVDSDADRLGRLITELLDAARLDSGRMRLRTEPLQLAVEIEKVLANVSAGAGRTVPAHVHGDIPTVWGDKDRLAQVFTNLIENGLVHGNGAVSITLAARSHQSLVGVDVCVDDEGSGFPHAVRGRVFTKFWHSGSSGGSGLGLYIVRGVVLAHRGTVGIEQSPSGGARVRVWLPVAEPAALRD
ncbi:MAG: PAS domain-containing sensor histidine kinase [Actinomycetota bacterium]|nr:PAS domain-containing sensor histidine kinase [Actinomycetota bacterium]